METNNVNKNVKELTDEQLKEVAGGIGEQECIQKEAECHALPDCIQQAGCLNNLKKNGCFIIESACMFR